MADNLRMNAMIFITAAICLWTLLMIIFGLSMGWRMRSGLPPMPVIVNPFRKKPEPEAVAPKVKPQVKV